MKIPRLILIIAVPIALFGVVAGGLFLYQEYELTQTVARQEAKIKAEKTKATTRPMADLAINKAVPTAYPKPVSDWIANDKTIYQKLLSAKQFDVLVVPFQVQEYALDRATRSLMTAELAMLIAKAQNVRVADTYQVARALGEGQRRVDAQEVYTLADKLNVQKIIWGYVGHNNQYQMSLTLQVQERNGGTLNAQTPAKTQSIENIAFSDEQPPIEIFQTKLTELLAAVGVDSAVLSTPKLDVVIENGELPTDMSELIKATDNPAQATLTFQLLGYLTPLVSDRARERFAEKAYLALLNLSEKAADYKSLKARTLMMLGFRPGALHVLGEPKTAEEHELLAALNGNQPSLEQNSAQIQPTIKKLIAQLDGYELEWKYANLDRTKSITHLDSLALPGKIWPFLASRAFTERDYWSQFDNLSLKQILDQIAPLENYSVESLIEGAAALNDTEKLQAVTDLSVVTHLGKILEKDAALLCCETNKQPGMLDVLSLIEAINDDNLLRRPYFLAFVQGLPERAIDFLNRLEITYRGHPRYAIMLALVQYSKASKLDGIARENLSQSAYLNAFNAYYWTQGQTYVAEAAFEAITRMQRYDFGDFMGFYASDYPTRPTYLDWTLDDLNLAKSEAGLKNSRSDLKHFKELNQAYSETMLAELLKSLEGRFIGNPDKYFYLADASRLRGDTADMEKYCREAIKVQAIPWWPYEMLGRSLIQKGQLQEAQALFLTWPGFNKDATINRVSVSNNAYQVATMFYWLGEFDLAKPFYQLSSKENTGSEGSMTSTQILSLLNKDYSNTLHTLLARAKRYQNAEAYGDFLSLLHAQGASKTAWNAFNTLAVQLKEPQIWESVLIGQRKDKQSEADIITWAKLQTKQSIGYQTNDIARHLLRSATMNRTPSMALVSALTDVAQPVYHLGRGVVKEEIKNGHKELVTKFMIKEGPLKPNDPFSFMPKKPIKSHLVYFAEAYVSLRADNLSGMHQTLKEAASVYDFTEHSFGYLLPYYAYSAAKSGASDEVKSYLANFTPNHMGFDYYLAQAVVEGIAGNTEQALPWLNKAFYNRPYTGNRPILAEYQYSEICLLLFQATNKADYKTLALDWARKHQIMKPWFAWAYALTALYSDNKQERSQAIAMAEYLDAGSEMLKQIPMAEKAAAIKAFKGKNPFLKKVNDINTLSI